MAYTAATRHLPAIVSFAHDLLRRALQPGDCAIDATAGNGHDTCLLAGLVGEAGHVFAFDVQPQALDASRERLQQGGLLRQVRLIHAGHETVAQHVDMPVQAAIFNLGWLPGSNKQVTTRPATTLAALDAVLQLLQPHGLMVLVIYQAHAGAAEERDAVEAWARELPATTTRVARYQLANVPRQPPYVLAVEKLG